MTQSVTWWHNGSPIFPFRRHKNIWCFILGTRFRNRDQVQKSGPGSEFKTKMLGKVSILILAVLKKKPFLNLVSHSEPGLFWTWSCYAPGGPWPQWEDLGGHSWFRLTQLSSTKCLCKKLVRTIFLHECVLKRTQNLFKQFLKFCHQPFGVKVTVKVTKLTFVTFQNNVYLSCVIHQFRVKQPRWSHFWPLNLFLRSFEGHN